MDECLRGRVAKILNSRELAINIGSKDGVLQGMFFDVLDAKGENISDPDTGEILGTINRPKVRVQVTQVYDRLSIASTFRKREINVGGQGLSLTRGYSDMFMPPNYVTKYETLKTTEKTWEDLDERQSYVKIGDPVIRIFEDQIPDE